MQVSIIGKQQDDLVSSDPVRSLQTCPKRASYAGQPGKIIKIFASGIFESGRAKA